MINAVNFVDGLDGLAAGMVASPRVAFFLYATSSPSSTRAAAHAAPTLFTAVLVGMCLGFLPHNINPARIFMGDSGSMLIGLVLAAAATSVTGRSTRRRLAAPRQTLPVFFPLLLPVPSSRSRSWTCCWRSSADGRAGRRSRRTRSTSTTGCWRSATRTAAPC